MTSTPQTASRFNRGGAQAVEEAEAQSTGGGGGYRKTHYFQAPGKGKSVVLRYVDESPTWFYIAQHAGVPTKAAPADWPADKKFPLSMPATCRYDDAFQAKKADPSKGIPVDLPAIYTDCYIDDAQLKNTWGDPCKPAIRVWARAVLREEVIGTQEMADKGQIPAELVGKRAGFRDKTREVEVPKTDDKGEVIKGADGKVEMETVTEIAIIVVNQAVSNYFGGLQSMYGMYQTNCDRDYAVQQNGEGKKVDYVHMPFDKTDNHKPGTESWKRYEDAIEAQGHSVDIEFIINDRASDRYFATFFDPSKTAPAREGSTTETTTSTGQGAPVQQQAAAPTSEPANPAALEAMRDRVRGMSAAPTSEAATAAPEQAQETTSAPAATAGAIDFV